MDPFDAEGLAGALDTLISWYDDLAGGRAPSIQQRRSIIEALRKTGTHPDDTLTRDINYLARPDPAHIRTDSLLAIERLRQRAGERSRAPQ